MGKKYFIFYLLALMLILIPLTSALAGDEYKFAWDKKFNDGSNGNDYFQSGAINNESIFVGGGGARLSGPISGADWLIKKFWLNGTEDVSWFKNYSISTANVNDGVTAMSFDNDSGIFIIGYVRNASGNQFAHIKRFWLNGSEDFTWNKTFSYGSTSIYSIAMDNNSGFFVVASGQYLVSGASGQDWWVKRFWLNGSEDFSWNKSVSSDSVAADIPDVVIVDNNSGVFVAGYGTDIVSGASGQDWWVKRFWLNGSEDFSWNKTFDGGSSNDVINDLTFDNQSGLYVAGFGTNLSSSTSNQDWWVKRFWLNGSEDFSWNKTFDGSGLADKANSIKYDNNSGIFVVGYGINISSSTSNQDWWVKRFWLNGSEDFSWNKTFNNNDRDEIYNVQFDFNKNIYLIGYGYYGINSSSSQDTWIKKFQTKETGIVCSFVNDSVCPSGSVKLIGLANDTYGYTNAHAEISTQTNYNYSLCCSNSNASRIIGNFCDEEVVIRLNQTSNSHVQIGSLSSYSNQVCLNSTYKQVSCTYNNNGFCPDDYQCILSMASSEGDNSTNAHINRCYTYSQNVCCKEANTPPTKPVLVYPQNNNNTFFERRVNFTWTASTDPESDSITYNLNATCGGGCGCANIYQAGISGINYTPSTTLCKDVTYNWTVAACDVYGDCNVSIQSNFTILSVTDFILIVNATSFGVMAQNQNDDTSDDAPNPLVGRNVGNVLINATMNATSLFVSIPLNTDYFMFKSSDNESGSINSLCSQTAYANFTALKRNVFCNLSFFDSFDEVRIDLNITIPTSESAGFKTSDIEIIPVISE